VYTWELYFNGLLILSISWFVPSYCEGEDIGEGGVEQGPGVREVTVPLNGGDRARVAQAAVRASALTSNARCNEALRNYGIPSLAALVGGLDIGSVVTNADGYDIPEGNIFDGRTSQSLIEEPPGSRTQITIAEYFRQHPNDPAVTLRGSGLIFLGPAFFNGDLDSQAITLLHEAAHRAGARDTDFGRNREEGSRNLTRLLRERCL
jgi:hypothetical protein